MTSKEFIISKKLIDLYTAELFTNKIYYVKLSILDYIDNICTYENSFSHIDLSLIEKIAYTKKEKLIVRNQALLILIKANISNSLKYLAELKININKSNNYQVHIRLYNTLLNNLLYKDIFLTDILYFIEISKKKNLGKAVHSIIEELECILLNK